MQKITPNLWFKKNAKEEVEYYHSIFSKGKVITTSYYPNRDYWIFKRFVVKEKLEIVNFRGKVAQIFARLPRLLQWRKFKLFLKYTASWEMKQLVSRAFRFWRIYYGWKFS